MAGAGVVCTGGFSARDVVGWIEEFRPTWYTAVPTIHQAMLQVARANVMAGRELPTAFLKACGIAFDTHFGTPRVAA